MVRAVMAAAGEVPLVWDPHPRGAEPVPGATLATPNHAEAQTLAALPGDDLPDGAGPGAAAVAGVRGAGAFLRKGGVAGILGRSAGKGARRRTGPGSGLVDLTQAQVLIAQVRSAGGSVVMAGGCFDLLHAGHVAYLEAARALGDCTPESLFIATTRRRCCCEGCAPTSSRRAATTSPAASRKPPW